MKYPQSLITSGIALVTQELQPLIYRFLLNKLLVRALTSTFYDQSSSNFLQMLRTMIPGPSLITSRIALETQELWPLIYRFYLINCLSTHSNFNILRPIFFKLSTNFEVNKISTKFDNQQITDLLLFCF